MLTLFHHPFCPHSRFIRLALAEMRLEARLVEERIWERRHDFLLMNPAGTTPVLIEEGLPAIPGAGVIAEYLDERFGGGDDDNATARHLMPPTISERIETRRLVSWFNDKFFAEASGPLVTERVFKRFMPEQDGGGEPIAETIRAARTNVRHHLAYLDWLTQTRDWLAGDTLTFADLAAAAQLSVVDYLGDVPWQDNAPAKAWYARVKSRPSFRALLRDIVPGLLPPAAYSDLDF